jgi:recombination associated protein RdgC
MAASKKERRKISEEVRLTMLPKAFPRRMSVMAWIDPAKGLLVIDAASSGVVDHVVGMLAKAIDGAQLGYHQFGVGPSALMTTWLAQADALSTGDRSGFDIGSGAQLKANDETKAVVTYKKHPLDTDEVKQHIQHGKQATRLDLVYSDRVAFTLTDNCVLSGVVFLDTVFENRTAENADRFDTDVVIMTGELAPLIKDLHDALDLQP